jgi:hypothetical protein
MTDVTRHERARRRPVVLSEEATSRAIREIEAEHSIYVEMKQRFAAPTTESPDRAMRWSGSRSCRLRFSDDTNACSDSEVEWKPR